MAWPEASRHRAEMREKELAAWVAGRFDEAFEWRRLIAVYDAGYWRRRAEDAEKKLAGYVGWKNN